MDEENSEAEGDCKECPAARFCSGYGKANDSGKILSASYRDCNQHFFYVTCEIASLHRLVRHQVRRCFQLRANECDN